MMHVPGRNGNDLLIFLSDVVAHTHSEEDCALYQKVVKMTFGEAVSTLYSDIRCPGSISALGIVVRSILKDLSGKGLKKSDQIPMGVMTVQELLHFKTIITDRLDSRLLYNDMPEESGPTEMASELPAILRALMGGGGPSSGIGLN